MGEHWWNFEYDVWGRLCGIVERVCEEEVGNCEDDMWGRICGNVKMYGAELVEF